MQRINNMYVIQVRIVDNYKLTRETQLISDVLLRFNEHLELTSGVNEIQLNYQLVKIN